MIYNLCTVGDERLSLSYFQRVGLSAVVGPMTYEEMKAMIRSKKERVKSALGNTETHELLAKFDRTGEGACEQDDLINEAGPVDETTADEVMVPMVVDEDGSM